MALYQYFKKASILPNPNGLLSTRIPSSAIAKANKEVEPLIKKSTSNKSGKRGQYQVYTDEKLKIGKQAAEMGVTSTIRFFHEEFSNPPLKESTVRTLANIYKRELALRRKLGKEMVMDKLGSERRGPPLLFGNELDTQVQEYVKSLREKGGVVNSAIVMAGAVGIVKSYDSNLLKESGGHIECSKSWEKKFSAAFGLCEEKSQLINNLFTCTIFIYNNSPSCSFLSNFNIELQYNHVLTL